MTGPVTESAQAGFMKIDRSGQNMLPQNKQAMALRKGSAMLSDDAALKDKRLKQAATDFEAIFVRQFMRSMRTSMLSGGMFGDGSTGEIYADMMDAAMADQFAEKGVLGISDVIYRQLVKEVGENVIPAENALSEE